MANTLLLQGPVGPLFAGLARELRRRGDRVWQVTFNGGDEFFADRQSAIPFQRGIDEWPFRLSSLLHSRRIDRVFLFGDCRPLHRIAVLICGQLGIPVYVVEEGYLRPFYLTIERGGVNGHSPLPREPGFYRQAVVPTPPEPRHYSWVFSRRILACIAYYVMLALRRRRYRHYEHYRGDSLVRESFAWVRAFWRRKVHLLRERRVVRELEGKPFFLVPLQVEGDTQLTHHSAFASVPAFIAHVIASFATHAPATAQLVIKHHPMDRGYNDYAWLIRDLARQAGITERVRYVHDVSLPALLRAAAGVVVVNSTVGLSALHHGTPTIALGEAIYDIPGLTNQGELNAFWKRPRKVDATLFKAFRSYLIHHTQLNGTSATTDADWSLLDRLTGEPAAEAEVRAPVEAENEVEAAPSGRTSARLRALVGNFAPQVTQALSSTE